MGIVGEKAKDIPRSYTKLAIICDIVTLGYECTVQTPQIWPEERLCWGCVPLNESITPFVIVLPSRTRVVSEDDPTSSHWKPRWAPEPTPTDSNGSERLFEDRVCNWDIARQVPIPWGLIRLLKPLSWSWSVEAQERAPSWLKSQSLLWRDAKGQTEGMPMESPEHNNTSPSFDITTQAIVSAKTLLIFCWSNHT